MAWDGRRCATGITQPEIFYAQKARTDPTASLERSTFRNQFVTVVTERIRRGTSDTISLLKIIGTRWLNGKSTMFEDALAVFIDVL
jgi:hypothetical protein